MARYLTSGGVAVVAIGPVEVRDGKEKVPCARLTGGFHGWLTLANLRTVH